MVIAYHLMWTAYGWWLPNDPRGSTSHALRNDLLEDLGGLHYGRKRVQPASRDIRTFYDQAARRLQHPLLAFDPAQFPQVAAAVAGALARCRYTCYAAAVMPDHVHLLIRKHRDRAEQMIEQLQAMTRQHLLAAAVRPAEHPVWTRGGWKVYLDGPDDIWRTIRYIEQNPVKLRLPRQTWPFVSAYDNWPEHKRPR